VGQFSVENQAIIKPYHSSILTAV